MPGLIDPDDLPEYRNAFNQAGELVASAPKKKISSLLKEHALDPNRLDLAVDVVYLMLMKEGGELLVVQRSWEESENPGRWDKSVGGHVKAGESYAAAALRELQEEIQVVGSLVESGDFCRTVGSVDTTRVAVLRQIDFDPWMASERAMKDGPPWEKRHRAAIYLGAYDGDVRMTTEAIEHEWVTREALDARITADPEKYARDLSVLLRRYRELFERDQAFATRGKKST